MKELSLIIDKILVSILVLMLFIDSLQGINLPIMAFLIPLLITGTIRSFIVLLVLIMNVTKYGYKSIGKIYRRSYKQD